MQGISLRKFKCMFPLFFFSLYKSFNPWSKYCLKIYQNPLAIYQVCACQWNRVLIWVIEILCSLMRVYVYVIRVWSIITRTHLQLIRFVLVLDLDFGILDVFTMTHYPLIRVVLVISHLGVDFWISDVFMTTH